MVKRNLAVPEDRAHPYRELLLAGPAAPQVARAALPVLPDDLAGLVYHPAMRADRMAAPPLGFDEGDGGIFAGTGHWQVGNQLALVLGYGRLGHEIIILDAQASVKGGEGSVWNVYLSMSNTCNWFATHSKLAARYL